MLGDRVVVPLALRPAIRSLLHAAHQGVTRMKSRSLESVYWPGITADITKSREDCQACHKMAKSNPTQPPYSPTDPEYLAAGYFHHLNNDYCVVVDRYSHWPVVS